MKSRLFGKGIEKVLKVASQIFRTDIAGELRNAVSGVGGADAVIDALLSFLVRKQAEVVL